MDKTVPDSKRYRSMVGLLPFVTFSDRFGILLRAKNLKPNQFAEKIGVAKQTAYNWYNGGTPTQQKHWEAVAQAFGLNVDDLRDSNAPLPEWALKFAEGQSESEEDDAEFIVPMKAMNYAGVVPASTSWGDPLTQTDETREVPLAMYSPGRFCASVTGYSCAPKVLPKDLLVVAPTSDPIHGTLVIAERADDYGVTLKRAELQEDLTVRLMPLNPNTEPIDDKVEWHTVGTVVGIYNPDTEPITTFYWPAGLRTNTIPNRI